MALVSVNHRLLAVLAAIWAKESWKLGGERAIRTGESGAGAATLVATALVDATVSSTISAS